eukprot:525801-Prorocentrum_minimum.AAC.1
MDGWMTLKGPLRGPDKPYISPTYTLTKGFALHQALLRAPCSPAVAEQFVTKLVSASFVRMALEAMDRFPSAKSEGVQLLSCLCGRHPSTRGTALEAKLLRAADRLPTSLRAVAGECTPLHPLYTPSTPLVAANSPLMAANSPLVAANSPLVAANSPLVAAKNPLACPWGNKVLTTTPRTSRRTGGARAHWRSSPVVPPPPPMAAVA